MQFFYTMIYKTCKSPYLLVTLALKKQPNSNTAAQVSKVIAIDIWGNNVFHAQMVAIGPITTIKIANATIISFANI